jgi:hypothetical protein
MDFLNRVERGCSFISVFPPFYKRLREFEEIEISMQSCRGLNNKEENSYDFCLNFVQEFGLYTLKERLFEVF